MAILFIEKFRVCLLFRQDPLFFMTSFLHEMNFLLLVLFNVNNIDSMFASTNAKTACVDKL